MMSKKMRIVLGLALAGVLVLSAHSVHAMAYRRLSIGSSGSDVRIFQDILIQQGFMNGKSTGYFGPITAQAVRYFQSKNNLEMVGSIGPATFQKLSAYINSKTLPTGTVNTSNTQNTQNTVPTPQPQTQPSDTPIVSCRDITQGGTYVLSSDLSASGTCISIHDTNNVILNCNNHMVSATGGSTGAVQVKNVNGFTVRSCTLNAVLWPALNIQNSNNGTVSGNTIQAAYVNSNGDGAIPGMTSTNLQVTGNTFVGGGYQQTGTSNSSISNNTFTVTATAGQAVVPINGISTAGGSGNTIAFNVMNGGWDSVIGSMTGMDDGIYLGDSNDVVKNNTFRNFFDAGIETVGYVSGTQFLNNTIDNVGITGIGGWYTSSWLGNTVRGNTVTNAPRLFMFYRDFGLQSNEQFVYFQDNIFDQNMFTPSRYSAGSSSRFDLKNVNSRNGGLITDLVIRAGNNRFSNNNFGTQNITLLLPQSMIVDAGGNTCKASDDPAYPLRCGN